MKREKSLRLFAAASGLAAAGLMFASALVHNIEVAAVSSSPTIAAAMVDAQQTGLLGAYLLMLGVFFFIFFAGYLRMGAPPGTPSIGWLVDTAFGAGMVAASMLLLSAHFGQALTILPRYGGETQVAKALYLLDWNWYLLVEAIPIAVFIAGNSAVGVLANRWPWWLNWPGLAISAILLLPFVTGGGIMLSYLWIAALSVYQLNVERRPNPV